MSVILQADSAVLHLKGCLLKYDGSFCKVMKLKVYNLLQFGY